MIERADVIDAMGVDAREGVVVLVMTEERAWSGEDAQLFQLQEKLNAYLSFVLDGEMAESHPELDGKPVRIVVRCAGQPDERTVAMLAKVREQIAFQGIDLEVHVAAASCGESCACAA